MSLGRQLIVICNHKQEPILSPEVGLPVVTLTSFDQFAFTQTFFLQVFIIIYLFIIIYIQFKRDQGSPCIVIKVLFYDQIFVINTVKCTHTVRSHTEQPPLHNLFKVQDLPLSIISTLRCVKACIMYWVSEFININIMLMSVLLCERTLRVRNKLIIVELQIHVSFNC